MFSFREYEAIIYDIKRSGKYTDFIDAKTKDRFIVVRHDVEFCVDRAYQLAELENRNTFHSTYLFQIMNQTYNCISEENIKKIKEIKRMGHTIGLHYRYMQEDTADKVKDGIRKQVHILEQMLDMDINVFSIHRPSKWLLQAEISVNGLINTYDPAFFTFTEEPEKNPPEIKYLSDARHQWNYGLEPTEQLFANYDKIQILMHPYSWTKEGYDNLNNFRTLISEKNEELMDSIDQECRHFKEIKQEL